MFFAYFQIFRDFHVFSCIFKYFPIYPLCVCLLLGPFHWSTLLFDAQGAQARWMPATSRVLGVRQNRPASVLGGVMARCIPYMNNSLYEQKHIHECIHIYIGGWGE